MQDPQFYRPFPARGILLMLAYLVLSCICPPSFQAQTAMDSPNMYKVKIIIGGYEIPVKLEDTPSGRDFARLLPLELSLTDYAGMEKVSSLPRELSTDGASEGYDPSVGDLTYYAPWGNLAIFYKDFGYARGLVKLGEIPGALSPLLSETAVKVRIEISE